MSDGFVVASCSASFGIFSDSPVKRLEAAGCEVRVNPYGRPLTQAECVEHARDAPP